MRRSDPFEAPCSCSVTPPPLCVLSGVQRSPADPVAVGEPAVHVCGAASQRQHGVLPGEVTTHSLLSDLRTKSLLFTVLHWPPQRHNVKYSCLPCQFMGDARDCESYLRQLQETIKRQYTCDRNSRLSKLEDLLQDSMVSAPLDQIPSRNNELPQ